MSYDFSANHISGFDNEFGGRLKLTFEDSPVTDVSFIKFVIRNSGRKTVERDDFDTPVTVNVMSKEILWTVVTKTNRFAIMSVLEITRNEHQITVHPLMLNAGDEIEMSILAQGFKDIAVIGRISGIRDLKRKSISPKQSRSRLSVLGISLAALLTFVAGTRLTVLDFPSFLLAGIAASVTILVATESSRRSK